MLHLVFLVDLVTTPPPAEPAASQRPPVSAGTRDRHDDEGDDEEEESRVQPDTPILVTGRRLDAARTRIDAALGATVYSLTNDAAENRPGGETGSLADILSQAPGAAFSGNGLVVRGARASQVRINDVIVPEAVSEPAEHLSARLADSTRLMTGTLPAQFGFAPGGVIGVTTKSGLYQHGGQAELFAGSRGMFEPAVEWSGSVAGTSLFASGSVERDRSMLAGATGIEARDARREIGGLVFADHVIDAENRLSLILGGSRERHRIGRTNIGPGTERSGDGYAVATFQHSDDGLTVQASLFAGFASDRADFTLSSRGRRTSLGTQIDATKGLGGGNVLGFGLLATRSRAGELSRSGNRVNAMRTATALYMQDEWEVAPSLTFNPGVRVEWLRGFRSVGTLEPRASIVWSPDGEFAAHAGYARYASAAPPGETGGGALRNERDDYYDVGVQRKLGALTLGIDGYWRAVRNLIVERETPGSAFSTPFAFRRARIEGLELSATYAHRGTTAWANFALSGATARSIAGGEGVFPPATTAAASAGLPLASDRPVLASGGITHRFDELTLSTDVVVSSGAVGSVDPRRPNGARGSPYALIGFAAVYHVRLAGRAADLRADISNIADVRVPTTDASSLEGGWTRPARGRSILVGIEQGF